MYLTLSYVLLILFCAFMAYWFIKIADGTPKWKWTEWVCVLLLAILTLGYHYILH